MNFYLNCINNNFPRHATCSTFSRDLLHHFKRNVLFLSRVRHDVEQGAADDHRGNKIHRESRFTVCIATFRSPYLRNSLHSFVSIDTIVANVDKFIRIRCSIVHSISFIFFYDSYEFP